MGIVNISGVGKMGVGETGVGEMGQIIGEMGVGETGTSRIAYLNVHILLSQMVKV